MKNIKFSSQADQWFPTTIWTSVLEPDSKSKINEEILKCLNPYIENSDLKNINYVVTDTDLHTKKNFKLTTFFLNRVVFEYLKFLKLEHHDFEITGCWGNITRQNFSHTNHSHQNNFVSGVYYVQTDKGKTDKIHFNDPREQNKVLVPIPSVNTRNNTNGAMLDAKEGSVILFPSWLRHEVPVHTSNDNRISIAFNAMFTNIDNMSKPGFSPSKK